MWGTKNKHETWLEIKWVPYVSLDRGIIGDYFSVFYFSSSLQNGYITSRKKIFLKPNALPLGAL